MNTDILRFSLQHPISGQLQLLRERICQSPVRASLRVYYFQLLAVLGEWSKALEQLQLCAQLDSGATPMARAYREAIRCEALRAEVFAGRRRPFLVGEPAEWLVCLIDALRQVGCGNSEAAQVLRARALADAPVIPGCIDGQAFEWLADSDTRLGPVCELIANGNYYWLPFDTIQRIGFEPVQDLRDLVWQPCEVVLCAGGVLQGFMPTRYPLAGNDDDGLKLARRTEWSDIGAGHVAGHGQRTWVTDLDDFPMLQVRSITLASL